jgi:hypothetical protein
MSDAALGAVLLAFAVLEFFVLWGVLACMKRRASPERVAALRPVEFVVYVSLVPLVVFALYFLLR